LKTLDACPLFVLPVVLLEDKQKFKHEDKQKFKHGGVLQVSYRHGYFYLFGLNFGIYLHYLMFYAHISPITLGFGLFELLIIDVLILSQVLAEKHGV